METVIHPGVIARVPFLLVSGQETRAHEARGRGREPATKRSSCLVCSVLTYFTSCCRLSFLFPTDSCYFCFLLSRAMFRSCFLLPFLLRVASCQGCFVLSPAIFASYCILLFLIRAASCSLSVFSHISCYFCFLLTPAIFASYCILLFCLSAASCYF